MDRDDGVTRQDYSNKAGEMPKERRNSKELSQKKATMTAGGTAVDGSRGTVTGSERHYPKSGSGLDGGQKARLNADFNPMRDKKRSGTGWAVDGV
jgi:hypothetical protein